MASRSELLARLSTITSADFPQHTRLFPTVFTHGDTNGAIYPRRDSWRWGSALCVMRHFGSIGAMMRLPLFWQLEIPLFEAAHEAGAFIFVNDAANMPLGAAAIRSADVDIVVTHAADAAEFSAYLRASHVALPAWLVIHPLSAHLAAVPPVLRDARAAEEVHLFPGVPVLVQCGLLADARTRGFHIADDYAYIAEGDRVRIRGTPHDAIPLDDFTIPLALRPAGECPCGKAIFKP